jgi:hypothetical protein
MDDESNNRMGMKMAEPMDWMALQGDGRMVGCRIRQRNVDLVGDRRIGGDLVGRRV